MKDSLILSIVRVCQSEYLRHNPRDELVQFLTTHKIGEWTGINYRITPENKQELAGLLMGMAGIDAFSAELGGPSMGARTAIISPSEKDGSNSDDSDFLHLQIQVRQFQKGKLIWGDFNGLLPYGMSLSFSHNLPIPKALHQSIVLTNDYKLFFDLDIAHLDTDDLFSPMTVFSGHNERQRAATFRMLRELNKPVYFAGDLTLSSVVFMRDVPLLRGMLLPSEDDLKSILAKHNDTEAFQSSFFGLEINLSDMPGPVGFLWKKISSEKIHLPAKHFCNADGNGKATGTPGTAQGHGSHGVEKPSLGTAAASWSKSPEPVTSKSQEPTEEQLAAFTSQISPEAMPYVIAKQHSKQRKYPHLAKLPDMHHLIEQAKDAK